MQEIIFRVPNANIYLKNEGKFMKHKIFSYTFFSHINLKIGINCFGEICNLDPLVNGKYNNLNNSRNLI